MAISTLNDLLAGMTSGAMRYQLNKSAVGSRVIGTETSHWRLGNTPAAGAAPTSAAICSDALTGAIPLAGRTGGQQRILASAQFSVAAAGHSILIEDRLGHMGGLSGTVTTAQTVNLDLDANLATSNLAARIGQSNYSEVAWYLEWYTSTGATITTPTVAVTFNDGTTGTANIWNLGSTALPATVPASQRYAILSPTADKYIRSVQSVTLSASTGTAGNFGVTAVRRLSECIPLNTNYRQVFDWFTLNAPRIEDNCCLTTAQAVIATTTGVLTGGLLQAVA